MSDNMKKLGLTKGSKLFLECKKDPSKLIELMPLIFESSANLAIYQWNKYEELIKVGFTPKQALELVK